MIIQPFSKPVVSCFSLKYYSEEKCNREYVAVSKRKSETFETLEIFPHEDIVEPELTEETISCSSAEIQIIHDVLITHHHSDSNHDLL